MRLERRHALAIFSLAALLDETVEGGGVPAPRPPPHGSSFCIQPGPHTYALTQRYLASSPQAAMGEEHNRGFRRDQLSTSFAQAFGLESHSSIFPPLVSDLASSVDDEGEAFLPPVELLPGVISWECPCSRFYLTDLEVSAGLSRLQQGPPASQRNPADRPPTNLLSHSHDGTPRPRTKRPRHHRGDRRHSVSPDRTPSAGQRNDLQRGSLLKRQTAGRRGH